jgi:hypothetical protein
VTDISLEPFLGAIVCIILLVFIAWRKLGFKRVGIIAAAVDGPIVAAVFVALGLKILTNNNVPLIEGWNPAWLVVLVMYPITFYYLRKRWQGLRDEYLGEKGDLKIQ